jgi:hypothetical protein
MHLRVVLATPTFNVRESEVASVQKRPNNPMVLTGRAGSLRSPARPAAHRVPVGPASAPPVADTVRCGEGPEQDTRQQPRRSEGSPVQAPVPAVQSAP